MGQMNFTCIGAAAASHRILAFDSVFVSDLMGISHKRVIGHIAVVHMTDLHTLP